MLNKFALTHDQEAQILVEQLATLAESGEQVDVLPYLKRCALDIICSRRRLDSPHRPHSTLAETSMGVKVNAQTQHDHPYVHAGKFFFFILAAGVSRGVKTAKS